MTYMAGLFSSAKEMEFASVAPFFTNISAMYHSCPKAEFFYISWLGQAVAQNRVISAELMNISYSDGYGTYTTQARGIQKKYQSSLQSSLVLQCEQMPILEGMISMNDYQRTVARPFCQSARYDVLFGKQQTKLVEDLKRVEMLAPPKTDALTILLNLLARNNLEIGLKFVENIDDYSRIMQGRGRAKQYWGA